MIERGKLRLVQPLDGRHHAGIYDADLEVGISALEVQTALQVLACRMLDAICEPDRVPRKPFLLVSNLRGIAQLD
jgi:hypothetical protein